MTNEDKAFAFANKNADKYINDEDPLDALRDGFLCGAQWKEDQMKSPWHKASEELPKDEGDYLIAYRVNDYRELKKIYMQTSSYHNEKWYPNAKYDGMQILAWMPIPEIKEEQK